MDGARATRPVLIINGAREAKGHLSPCQHPNAIRPQPAAALGDHEDGENRPQCDQAHIIGPKVEFRVFPAAGRSRRRGPAQTRGVWASPSLQQAGHASTDGQKEKAPMSDHSYSKFKKIKPDDPAQSDLSSNSKRTAPSHFPTNVSAHRPHSVPAPRGPVSSAAGPVDVPAYYSVAAPHGPVSSGAGPGHVPAYYSVAAPHGPVSSAAGPVDVPAYYSVAAPHGPVSSGAGPGHVPAYSSVAALVSSGPSAANIT